ncbi:MAG: hypothetical protein LAT66_00775 [Alkalimonas sp.]|nr:hypothetical protein [Alkalimonas sp.]
MTDFLRNPLLIAASTETQATLLPRMGYAASDDRAWARVHKVLESPCLGLEDSHYDFRHNGADFLRVLGQALNFEKWLVDLEINRIQLQLKEERDAFQPYLWLDTGFKRQNQPIFALAACEQHRHLYFSKQHALLPLATQLSAVKQRIHTHQQKTAGDAGIWGQVQQYLYYHAASSALVFSIHAELIGERTSEVPDKATLTVNGQSLFS